MNKQLVLISLGRVLETKTLLEGGTRQRYCTSYSHITSKSLLQFGVNNCSAECPGATVSGSITGLVTLKTLGVVGRVCGTSAAQPLPSGDDE